MLPAFTLGDMLRQLRLERGLTQTALARRLGLSGNAMVSRLERGTAAPSAALQRKLARVFQVEASLLSSRQRSEARGSTASALLSDLGQAFEGVRQQLDLELASLGQSLAGHQARLGQLLRLSELQLLWGHADKLAYEATVTSAWVVTPDLLLDVESQPLRAVVRANLARGVHYRYLVPDSPGVLRRARKFLESFRPGPAPELRATVPVGLLFLSELVLYDPQSSRRLGLMVAPTARSDVDCVLSPTHAARLARAFEEAWRTAAPVELGKTSRRMISGMRKGSGLGAPN